MDYIFLSKMYQVKQKQGIEKKYFQNNLNLGPNFTNNERRSYLNNINVST